MKPASKKTTPATSSPRTNPRGRHLGALVQRLAEPRLPPHLEPFEAAGLLENGAPRGAEAPERYEAAAAAASDLDLEDFLFAVGWRMNWGLPAARRVWRGDPRLPNAVRDALLGEAARRGLAELSPPVDLLRETASLAAPPVRIRPLLRRDAEAASTASAPGGGETGDGFLSDAFLAGLPAGDAAALYLNAAGAPEASGGLTAAQRSRYPATDRALFGRDLPPASSARVQAERGRAKTAEERVEHARRVAAGPTHPLFLADLGLRLWRLEADGITAGREAETEPQDHDDGDHSTKRRRAPEPGAGGEHDGTV